MYSQYSLDIPIASRMTSLQTILQCSRTFLGPGRSKSMDMLGHSSPAGGPRSVTLQDLRAEISNTVEVFDSSECCSVLTS